MDCKAFRREMEELDAGQPLSTVAQAHVDSCPACRTFQSERLSLRQLVASLGGVGAPADFDFRLRARLANARSADNGALLRARFAPSLKAIAVAASFALLISAAVVFKQSQPARPGAGVATRMQVPASESDTQTVGPIDEQRQLANASQGAEVPSVVNGTPISKTVKDVSAVGRAEKIARFKPQRSRAPMKTERSPIFSNEITFRGNPPVITPVQPSSTSATNDTAQSTALLQVSSQPVKVLLHDSQGATRAVSLGPVIFGSQNFLERAAVKRNSPTEVEGIW